MIGGGAITGIFGDVKLFGAYAVGLAVGFFSYLVVSIVFHLLGLDIREILNMIWRG